MKNVITDTSTNKFNLKIIAVEFNQKDKICMKKVYFLPIKMILSYQ